MSRFPRWRFGLMLILWIATARADGPPALGEVKPPLGLPPEAAEVQIVQRLGEPVPADLAFRDDTDTEVHLGDYYGRRPILLVPAYFKCPMLCNQVLQGVQESLRVLRFTPGVEFELVVVSFHPAETPQTAAARKAAFLERYGRHVSGDGCHFLTGDQENIDRLCDAIGFRKLYDARRDEFIHASGIMVLTPRGEVSRYLLGIRYPPRDLRLALVEASENKIGTLADRLVLLCFHYDPASGQYTLAIMNVVRIGGVLTVCALVGFIAWNWRRRGTDGQPVPPRG